MAGDVGRWWRERWSRRGNRSAGQHAADPVGLPTLVAWHRTGLVLGFTAVGCFLGLVLSAAVGSGPDVTWALFGLGSIVCGFLAVGFLQRTWEDPQVAGDPLVSRARRLSSVAGAFYGLSVVLNAVDVIVEVGRWLGVVSGVLGCVAAVGFLAMLAVAARWRPTPAGA